VLAFNASLIHELGHVHAAENPAIYDKFAAQFMDWTSPSHYGQTSPEEGYAEHFLHELWSEGIVQIEASRFLR
jgi:hypothetical protein